MCVCVCVRARVRVYVCVMVISLQIGELMRFTEVHDAMYAQTLDRARPPAQKPATGPAAKKKRPPAAPGVGSAAAGGGGGVGWGRSAPAGGAGR